MVETLTASRSLTGVASAPGGIMVDTVGVAFRLPAFRCRTVQGNNEVFPY
jgi:hypothetical protein